MYLTAQRVRSRSGAEGINAFVHGHGPYSWHGEPPFTPEENPGTLFDSAVDPTVPPPGNSVRSYVDILTPDTTPADRIDRAFEYLIATALPERLPATMVVGPCWFRFGMEDTLSANWRDELRKLFTGIRELLERHGHGAAQP